jgi:hypothetical protein
MAVPCEVLGIWLVRQRVLLAQRRTVRRIGA